MDPAHPISRNVLRALGHLLAGSFHLPTAGGAGNVFINMAPLLDQEVHGCVIRRNTFINKYGAAEWETARLLGLNHTALTSGRPPNHPKCWMLMEAVFLFLNEVKCSTLLLHALAETGVVCTSDMNL